MNETVKKITILGSTGSIGIQTLDVVRQLNPLISINYLTVNTKYKELEVQIKEFSPKGVVITDENSYKEFCKYTSFKGKILFGTEGLLEASSDTDNDMLVSALVGFSGLMPTYTAIENGIDIALANKETLVVAGEIMTNTAKLNNVNILPVDSEHNAIFQCLAGETHNKIDKIILTASGGPFRETALEKFDSLTVDEALNHPNWNMGNKISIDSATMMNKGFEVIEAFWLFGTEFSKIEVLIHPESIIHSMVQFTDASVKAQLGLPDMRVPISYVLTYPQRYEYNFPKLNLSEISTLNFYKPDNFRFKCLDLAYRAIKLNGNAPTILNAANEITVEAFLNEGIRFSDIANINEILLDKINLINNPTIEEIIDTDKETRIITNELVTNRKI